MKIKFQKPSVHIATRAMVIPAARRGCWSLLHYRCSCSLCSPRTRKKVSKKNWKDTSIKASSFCREILNARLREKLREGVDVNNSAHKDRGTTYLQINKNIPSFRNIYNKHKEFIYLADALVGTLGVALNPDRKPGDWWRTRVEDFMTNKKWFGIDNFFIRHPALVSLVTGMYRQVWLTCLSDKQKEALEYCTRKEVVSCLNNCDSDLAMQIIQRMKPAICVTWNQRSSLYSYYDLASSSNLPIPTGHWEKFLAWQKAISNNGLEKTLGGTGAWKVGAGGVYSHLHHRRA